MQRSGFRIGEVAGALAIVALIGCGGATLGNGGAAGAGGATGGRGGFYGDSAGATGIAGQPGGGDAGSSCPPLWTPPDAPDGGYAPSPPRLNGPPGCAYIGCPAEITNAAALDDRSLGVSAMDLLDRFARPGSGVLTWYDGSTTTVHLAAAYVEPTVQISGPVGSPDAGADVCRTLEADGAVITLATDDGRLAGEDFPAMLMAERAAGMTQIWANGMPVDVSALHGSFQAPAAWGAGVGAQQIHVLITPATAVCAANCPDPADSTTYAFADIDYNCGYDGKIVWTAAPVSFDSCPREVTVATWQWSQ